MFHVLLIILDRNLLVMGGHLHLYNPNEQAAIERAACWKLNICQGERGVVDIQGSLALG